MDRRFIIIHPSLIVQKGLHGILRDAYADDFLLLSNAHELQDYSSLAEKEIIIIYDYLCEKHLDVYLKNLQDLKNQVELIAISNDDKSDKYIHINDVASTVIHKVKKLLDKVVKEPDGLSELTEREKDVLKLVALGYQNKEIADKLFISIHTVISHRKHITEKLSIKSISGLTVYAILNKLIDTKNIDPASLI